MEKNICGTRGWLATERENFGEIFQMFDSDGENMKPAQQMIRDPLDAHRDVIARLSMKITNKEELELLKQEAAQTSKNFEVVGQLMQSIKQDQKNSKL